VDEGNDEAGRDFDLRRMTGAELNRHLAQLGA
jgi:hypothetical protein